MEIGKWKVTVSVPVGIGHVPGCSRSILTGTAQIGFVMQRSSSRIPSLLKSAGASPCMSTAETLSSFAPGSEGQP